MGYRVDQIEFRTVVESMGGDTVRVTALHPVVNGRLLSDLAGVVEARVADRADRKLAGSYAALPKDRVEWPSRHFLGQPAADLTWFESEEPILLGCPCGEAECWPLVARIDIEPGLVTWSNFRNGHRDWDLSDLGPFCFAEDDYRRALEATGR